MVRGQQVGEGGGRWAAFGDDWKNSDLVWVMVEHPGWSVGLEQGCPSGTGSAEGQEDRWPSANVHKDSALDFDITANESVNSGTELE